MKPTQEQILRALNKLVRKNKTELKAEKVELGMVDDIEKLFKQTQKEFKQIDSKLTALKKELNTALIHTINIDGQAKTIIKQAKELGVNDLVKTITSIQSKAEGLRKDYEPTLKAIK
tara:strand:- start:30 stop:380 length:351 start_codon:yes stop_codon:yes gene_type:complete